jgi:hypothetical protein
MNPFRSYKERTIFYSPKYVSSPTKLYGSGEGTGKGTAHFGPHLPMIEKNMVNDSEIDQRTYTQTIGECHYR